MGKPHKHADLIKAWADGAEIQFKAPCEYGWRDCTHPDWQEVLQYRIKPKTVKYRLYLWKNKMDEFSVEVVDENCLYVTEDLPGFVTWLGDWNEVEV